MLDKHAYGLCLFVWGGAAFEPCAPLCRGMFPAAHGASHLQWERQRVIADARSVLAAPRLSKPRIILES